MKIGVVQTRPVRGDVEANLSDHQRWIDQAIEQRVDLLVFPELSITGYEPALARELATTKEDARFDGLQRMADKYGIFICAGMPIRGESGVLIGMLIFRPDEPRQVYAKQYLHGDELAFFTPGSEQMYLSLDDNKIALSICYELSVAEHSVDAYSNRANIYLSSSAKTVEGAQKALEMLIGITCTYSMTALMANCVGPSGDGDCGGQSAVINDQGEVLAVLEADEEGLLSYDTRTGEVGRLNRA